MVTEGPNKTIVRLVRQLLMDLLSQCNESEHTLFKRMYSPKDLNKPIEGVVEDNLGLQGATPSALGSAYRGVVEGMDVEKLDWAVTQVENTLKNKNTHTPKR